MFKGAMAFTFDSSLAIVCADDPATTEADEIMWFSDGKRAGRALRFIELGDAEIAETLAYRRCTGPLAADEYRQIRGRGGEAVGTLDGYSHDRPFVTLRPWDQCTSDDMCSFVVGYLAACLGL